MCQFTDRFYSAVRTLASDGAVKQRLLAAYKDNLENLPVKDVPESIREPFETLRAAMTAAEPIGKECAVLATVRKMSASEATGFAGDIVAMFSELVRAKSTGERVSIAKPAETADKLPGAPTRLSIN